MNGIRWVNSINEIPKKEWDKVFFKDVVNDYNLIKSVEQAKIEGIIVHYLIVKEKQKYRAIIPCFEYCLDLSILTEGFVKKLIFQVQKKINFFLKTKIFFIGTPIAICDKVFGIDKKEDRQIIIKVLKEIKRKGKELKCFFIIVKELRPKDDLLINSFKQDRYILAHSLPQAFIPLSKELGEYPKAFRKKYRNRLKKQWGNSEKCHNFHWLIKESFGQHAIEMQRLYYNVFQRSKVKFEKLNSDFFKNISENLKGKVFVLLCKNEDKLVCFELILENENSLVPLYLGIDYDYNRDGILYFTCINKIIKLAEKKGKELVCLGQTSYTAKAYAGAAFENLYIALFAYKYWASFFIKVFKSLLFPQTKLPYHRVYKDESVPKINKLLKEHKIEMEKIKNTTK